MADPVTELAMTGASTIVAAMATGAWQAARDGVVRLFRRHGDAPGIDVQLEGDAAVLAKDKDADGARAELAAAWKRRLAALLRDEPEAAAELVALIDEVGGLLPDRQTRFTQTNIAGSGGQVLALQGDGSVYVYRAAADSSRPAPRLPAPGEEPGGAP